MTAVRLINHEGRRLQVRGLDAYEGTPVLDIKPYLRKGDLIPEATMPEWLERLWEIHAREREDPS
jgi:tRNA (Thr-GGU) A37 N-methylase